MIKRKSLVDQEIKGCFKAGSSDQEQILAIKNFDRRRRWKYRVHSGDYPLTKKLNFITLFQIGSPTALADGAAYERIFTAAKAKASIFGLYVPVGAFWGGQDIQKMADRGTLKV